ncbi:hypothetical protein Aph01nite_58250 [Acrocarpospora phusangensis]|uniref:DUF998 domain-containing protein n=1 Tax=Acrocarpospora phusangensis TaxID=1070424 RepID=A0A919UTK9_9ACTN|nr:DUF998 domain-containing protein [Acrocarpospora phusangensis]GIH27515.1 hypothetical protein Aph01nite_58250 [Acrocarpospora phusangensis]
MRRLAVAGPSVALAVMLLLHLLFPGVVDPLNGLLSDYALGEGTAALFVLGMLALAAGACAAAYHLATVDPVRSAAARVLLVMASAGLVLSAVFPTDAAPVVNTLSGEIHRWSTALVFTALPGAGWILARQSRRPLPGVRALSLASVVTLAAYLLSHPGSPVAELIGGTAFYGLLERLVVVLEIVLLISISAVGHKPQTISKEIPAHAPYAENIR